MQLPGTDFQLYMCCTPKRVQSKKPVEFLIQCSQLLEMAQYQAYWAKADTDSLCTDIPGFLVAVRAFILGVVTISYQSVSTAFLGECLNLTGSDLDAVVAGEGYSKDGDMITIPGNGEVSGRARAVTTPAHLSPPPNAHARTQNHTRHRTSCDRGSSRRTSSCAR